MVWRESFVPKRMGAVGPAPIVRLYVYLIVEMFLYFVEYALLNVGVDGE